MNEVWRQSASLGVDVDAESTEIAALEAALDALDALDPTLQDAKTRARRDELHSELFEVRGKRIDRVIQENWETLEKLVGRKLLQ